MPPAPDTLPYRPCVGVMLINQDGLIFAGQRFDSDAPAWQMPQGGIDPGESPRAAALRELKEETGIGPEHVEIIDETEGWMRYDLPEHLLGKVWGGDYRGQEQRWFLMRFTGADDEIHLDTEHPEFSEWRWLRADALLASIVPFKHEVYSDLIKRFRLHLAD